MAKDKTSITHDEYLKKVKYTRSDRTPRAVAEIQLLGCLVANPALKKDSVFVQDNFGFSTNKTLITALIGLLETNQEITEISLFKATNALDPKVSSDLCREVVRVSKEVMDYQAISKEVLRFNKTARIQNEIAELSIAAQTNSLDPMELLQQVEGLKTLIETADWGESNLLNFEQWFDIYESEIEKRGTGKTYSTGDPLLDKHMTMGFAPGAITTIAAGSGQGKTVTVINLNFNMVKQNIPCLFLSLEQDLTSTMDRWISKYSQIPYYELINPSPLRLVEFASTRANARSMFDNKKLFMFSDRPDLDLNDVYAMIREFQTSIGQDYCVVTIDLLTMLREFYGGDDHSASTASKIEAGMNRLNIIAKTCGVHIVAVVQMNRQLESKGVGSFEGIASLRPTDSFIKNSHAIAERSRTVIALFRPKAIANKLFPDDPRTAEMEDELELHIVKQNMGPQAVVRYLFKGETASIFPLVSKDELPADCNEEVVVRPRRRGVKEIVDGDPSELTQEESERMINF